VLERRLTIEGLPRCGRLLDLGCGDGAYVPYLRERASEVVGLDVSPERVGRARGKGVEVVLADASSLPFRDGSFDVVWASEVVEHTPSLRVFGELERVARRMVAVTVPNPRGPYYQWDPTHILSYSVSSLKAFLGGRAWRYEVHGLGLCLPHRALPDALRRLLLRLTWGHPGLALNLLVTGKSKGGGLRRGSPDTPAARHPAAA